MQNIVHTKGWFETVMESLNGLGLAEQIRLLQVKRKELGAPRKEGDFPSSDLLSQRGALDYLIKQLEESVGSGAAGNGTTSEGSRTMSRGLSTRR